MIIIPLPIILPYSFWTCSACHSPNLISSSPPTHCSFLHSLNLSLSENNDSPSQSFSQLSIAPQRMGGAQ